MVAVRVAYRSAIAAAVLGALTWVAWPMQTYLPPHWAVLSVIIIATAMVGYPAGHAVSRKLEEDCGLGGGAVLVAVCVVLLAAEVVACRIAASFRGDWGPVMFFFAAGLVGWSLAACVKNLVLG
jgi:hypothetical protein